MDTKLQIQKTVLHIPAMDCSAEEQMIKLKLAEDPTIQELKFDLSSRYLTVYHNGIAEVIQGRIRELTFTSHIIEDVPATLPLQKGRENERRLLWYVFLINASCFLLEMVTGIISMSMGLVADSLDMLADAFVYGLSIYAVGKAAVRKKQIAGITGYLQISLAVIGFVEVLRRFLYPGDIPDFRLMIVISLIALAGNAVSLWLLQKTRSDEAHIRASMIFTSNDVIVNIGVIAAAILVSITGSNNPDLIVGTIIFILVIRGAVRILNLSKT